MVKIPGFDDLKKMGSDLMDSAKTVNIGGMVDKLKSGKPTSAIGGEESSLASLVQAANVTFVELASVQAQQAQIVKKLQGQLAEINRVVATSQKPAATDTVTKQDEGKNL